MKNIFIALLFLTLSTNISTENFFPREILSSEDSFNLSASVYKDDLIISILINEKSYIYSEQLSLKDFIIYDINTIITLCHKSYNKVKKLRKFFFYFYEFFLKIWYKKGQKSCIFNEKLKNGVFF